MSDSIDSLSGIGAATGTASASDAAAFTQARQDAMNAAATALGMSPTDLRTAMSSGETLTQLAAAKGISSADLQGTISAALKKDLPNATAAQLNTLSSRMMTGSQHAQHAHGGHHAGGAGGAGGASASASSSSSADATGDGNDLGSTISVVV